MHPEYYEGLPFVRLRRFDQPVDEFDRMVPSVAGGRLLSRPTSTDKPGLSSNECGIRCRTAGGADPPFRFQDDR